MRTATIRATSTSTTNKCDSKTHEIGRAFGRVGVLQNFHRKAHLKVSQIAVEKHAHPGSERLADYLIVVEYPVPALPDGLGLHAVEADGFAAFKENHHISLPDQGSSRRLTLKFGHGRMNECRKT